MLTIKKVLNSSVILVEDPQGRESILLGKGIGYGRRPGTPVPTRKDGEDQDQVFIPVVNTDVQNLVELLTAIPTQYLEITRGIVTHAQDLGMTLHPHIYLALTDHLHFAVERSRENLVVTNRLAWEIQHFYPEEFAVGRYGLTLLRDKLAVELPDEEAANIAFHVANARHGDASTKFDTLQAVKLIDAVVTIVRYSMNLQLMDQSLHFARFMSHMRYFATRFLENRMLTSPDDFLFGQVSRRYPHAHVAAEKIRNHITAQYGQQISNEEVAYLTLHIERLASP